MIDPSEYTEEQRLSIHAKIAELNSLLKDVTEGSGFDLMVICHPQHADGEKCNGVFVLGSIDVPLENAHTMMMQGLILIEGALIQRQIDGSPPPGTTIN